MPVSRKKIRSGDINALFPHLRDTSNRCGQILIMTLHIIDLDHNWVGILLSILLKTFLNKSKSLGDNTIIHPDTEFSLSLIESGCLFALTGEQASLIIKSTRDDINIMKNFRSITVDFELIERPEFPSLAFYINIDTKSERTFRYEYFFSTESAEEMRIIRKVCGEKRLDILLYNSAVEYAIHAEVSEEQASRLGSLLSGVRA
jgi:hypothetical protein